MPTDDYVFASDGGHYENTGITELVNERCTEIWCIDASADPPGQATALAEALQLITAEFGLQVEIDLDAFALSENVIKSDLPRVANVHVTGRIFGNQTDSQGGQAPYDATVHIIKLGADANCSTQLQQLRAKFPRFPYNSTLNQLYSAEHFDMYCKLGYENTGRAIAAATAV